MNRCIVCYNCETNLPFFEEACLEFLTNACWQIFLQTQLSNFFFQKQQMALSVQLSSRDVCLPFQGIQQTNMSGEQVSFCLTIYLTIQMFSQSDPTVKFTISAVKFLT